MLIDFIQLLLAAQRESSDWARRKGGGGEEAEVKDKSEQKQFGAQGVKRATGKEEKDVGKDGGTAESKMIEEREKIERRRAWSCYQSEAGASSRS